MKLAHSPVPRNQSTEYSPLIKAFMNLVLVVEAIQLTTPIAQNAMGHYNHSRCNEPLELCKCEWGYYPVLLLHFNDRCSSDVCTSYSSHFHGDEITRPVRDAAAICNKICEPAQVKMKFKAKMGRFCSVFKSPLKHYLSKKLHYGTPRIALCQKAFAQLSDIRCIDSVWERREKKKKKPWIKTMTCNSIRGIKVGF